MLEFIYLLIQGIKPFLAPVCFFVAWTVIILVVLNLWFAARDTWATAQQMHKIPCHNCQFFTNNYRLKCTVNPVIANTEAAINCFDYQQTDNRKQATGNQI